MPAQEMNIPIPIPSWSEIKPPYCGSSLKSLFYLHKQKPATMKRFLLTLAAILFVPLFLYSQSDQIIGTWYTEKGTSTVDVYKGTDGKYYGKVSWLEEPLEDGKPKVDSENPDPQLAKRPIMGLPLVNGFKYSSGKEQWVNGTIYDPDNGKTYDCFAWFEDGNYRKLYIKGYVMGIKALGRKTEWKRK
jgi:uncharacterized protein (DUF2147 family)